MQVNYSYSRIKLYEHCPRAYKYKYVDKIKVSAGDTAALNKGIDWHNSVELYLKGETACSSLVHMNKHAMHKIIGLKEANYESEKEYVFNFNGISIIAIIDAIKLYDNDFSASIVDFKTGSYSVYKAQNYMKQLKFYASLIMIHWPLLLTVKCDVLFLENGISNIVEFKRSELYTMQELIAQCTTLGHDIKPKYSHMCKFCQYLGACDA